MSPGDKIAPGWESLAKTSFDHQLCFQTILGHLQAYIAMYSIDVYV